MSYQALYRVWRPQTFDELVGQDMISETLKNAIKNEQLSHAYLFTGPRGTGKTSAAKILAKAINCPHQTDGNPCNECEICQMITAGQLSDVIEIDAASNNGVEEIRDLRDKVRYAATQAEYKVYIIDEVHMLTTGAFNALLKTLEEPPEKVVFIMATTEPHKIPATILSRVQRFDFRRIQDEDLIGRMRHILDHDGIPYQAEGLAIIARAANGGMRDSLSLLDQALSYQQDELTVAAALEVSGSLYQQDYVDYLLALHQQDSQAALAVVQDQLARGKQTSRFIEELILFLRDVLLTSFTGENYSLLSQEELSPLLEALPTEDYYWYIDQLTECQQKMRLSSQPDMYLEVVTLQLIHRPQATTTPASPRSLDEEELQPLYDRIEQLEEQLAFLRTQVDGQAKRLEADEQAEVDSPPRQANDTHGERPTAPVQRVKRERPAHMSHGYQLMTQHIYHVLNQATHTAIHELKAAWPNILSELSPQHRRKFIGTEPLAAGPEVALISFPSEEFCGAVQQVSELRQLIEATTDRVLGHGVTYTYIVEDDWKQIRHQYTVLRKQHHNEAVPIDAAELKHEADQLPADPGSSLSAAPALPADTPEDTAVEPVTERSAADMLTDADAPVFSAEGHDEANSERSPLVDQAIEIFGEENINIYYDR